SPNYIVYFVCFQKFSFFKNFHFSLFTIPRPPTPGRAVPTGRGLRHITREKRSDRQDYWCLCHGIHENLLVFSLSLRRKDVRRRKKVTTERQTALGDTKMNLSGGNVCQTALGDTKMNLSGANVCQTALGDTKMNLSGANVCQTALADTKMNLSGTNICQTALGDTKMNLSGGNVCQTALADTKMNLSGGNVCQTALVNKSHADMRKV
ncbi:Hypothetical protein, putative, partial [Bodo saltans]